MRPCSDVVDVMDRSTPDEISGESFRTFFFTKNFHGRTTRREKAKRLVGDTRPSTTKNKKNKRRTAGGVSRKGESGRKRSALQGTLKKKRKGLRD